MDKLKILHGDELVARGTTKKDGSLPERGLKDVIPNGSWLEQKQVQSALEARKHLIEVERIEKCGMLSQAEWREELMLAEVMQKVGGHWQYVGHNVGKQLFLKPEEALFLMEVNCLQLKHDEVTVSLQQAYSLLFHTRTSLMQYKVYAALSKVGYKVFRHEPSTPTAYEKKINLIPCGKKLNKEEIDQENGHKGEENTKKISESNEETTAMDIDTDNPLGKDNNNGHGIEKMPDKHQENEVNSDTCINSNGGLMETVDNVDESESSEKNPCDETYNAPTPLENESSNANSSTLGENNVMSLNNENKKSQADFADECSNTNISEKIPNNFGSIDCIGKVNERPQVNYPSKLQILENRKFKPNDSKILQNSFMNIPDLLQNVVTVKVPEEQFIPRNVFLNSTTYVLNLESIKKVTKNARLSASDSRSYSMPQEVNEAHVRRVRDSSTANTPQHSNRNWTPTFHSTPRFQIPSFQFRPFWRPNYSLLNMFFNRPSAPFMDMGFVPRPPLFPRPPMPFFGHNIVSSMNLNPNNTRIKYMTGNSRKRIIDTKRTHLEAIKRLAYRLSMLVESGNNESQNVQSLQRLIETYNARYKTRIRLSERFEIIEHETIVETIELDCEGESARKKPRIEPENNKYEENFNRLKQLALSLKDLEGKDKASGRHRRAFSNVIKRFNKSYNADVYLNSNYELSDRFLVNLDSSSDSDCIIEEIPTPNTSSGKKLKNPFNILKRLSEKHLNISQPTTRQEGMTDKEIVDKDKQYTEFLVKTFNKTWLPDENNFGRAEVLPRKLMYHNLLDSKRQEYLFEFLKAQCNNFTNWPEIKIAFLRSVSLSADDITNGNIEEDDCELKSLIGPKDCTDMPSVLKKLSIIQTNTEIPMESSLSIDFDVYNRDVQNFRKTNRPKPHFRVVCIDESASFPSGSDICALHSKYSDNVAILFAVVGMASVTFLQINPTTIPVYLPSNEDLT